MRIQRLNKYWNHLDKSFEESKKIRAVLLVGLRADLRRDFSDIPTPQRYSHDKSLKKYKLFAFIMLYCTHTKGIV